MSIIFAGSDSSISLTVFRGLVEKVSFSLVLVQQDRSAGRGRKIQRSELATIAESYGIPVYQPRLLGSEARDVVSACKPELLVCTAYGRILGPRFLALFPRGAINMHPSLLPKYRGPSPIQATILNGDSKTGVSIHYMTEEIDAGDILFQQEFPLQGKERADELANALGSLAAAPMLSTIDAIMQGGAKSFAQEEKNAVYCKLIHKEHGRIDWSSPAYYIERMIRAYYPWPGVYAGFRDTYIKFHVARVLAQEECKEMLQVKENKLPGTILGHVKGHGVLIQTQKDCLAVTKLQLAGRKVLDYQDFLNGVDLIGFPVLT